MNKSKLSIAAASRALLNLFLVLAMIVLASLVGVGGAALWIYSRAETVSTAKISAPRLQAGVAANDSRNYPLLTPVQLDNDTPAQLTPARYVPASSEIATLSDTPRYTYVSYNGGRQQAHLRVNTVLSTDAPAPLASQITDDATAAQATDRPPLSEPASHYITDSHGRVVGVDGTAGALAEARAEQVTVASVLPVKPRNLAPEIRVATPVVTRKALPVGDELAPSAPSAFDVRAEISREDEPSVQSVQPVAKTNHSARTAIFGASDSFRTFGRD